MHGIIKSKFKPGKWVQKQGTQWVEVHPFGKTEGVAEGAVKDFADDLKHMAAEEFHAKYKMTKAEARSKARSVNEEATAGSTMAANIGTVDAPQLSPGKARGKKSYTGTPGHSGTKAPPQPKVMQPKTSAGTAKNALDMKANVFGQAKESAVIKRR
jgi:hypothetical protein